MRDKVCGFLIVMVDSHEYYILSPPEARSRSTAASMSSRAIFTVIVNLVNERPRTSRTCRITRGEVGIELGNLDPHVASTRSDYQSHTNTNHVFTSAHTVMSRSQPAPLFRPTSEVVIVELNECDAHRCPV